jgi:hypothetical protein
MKRHTTFLEKILIKSAYPNFIDFDNEGQYAIK